MRTRTRGGHVALLRSGRLKAVPARAVHDHGLISSHKDDIQTLANEKVNSKDVSSYALAENGTPLARCAPTAQPYNTGSACAVFLYSYAYVPVST